MKKTVRTMIALLSLILFVLIGNTSIFAASEDIADEFVLSNWYPLAGKYSYATDKIIAPKTSGYKPKDVGFEFNVNEAGGVDIVVPNQQVFNGLFPVAALSSKNTTPLANLNVRMSLAEETVFRFDSYLADIRFCLLWTETETPVLADVQSTDRPGLEFANAATTNGFRHLISLSSRGLSVMVSNTTPKNIGTKVATCVYVVLHDGIFEDPADYRPGYRWSFIARNHPDSINADSSGISRGYEAIDLTNGLEIAVREDSALGYVVIINGKEYYKGSEVGYFPNDTGSLDEMDYGFDGMCNPTLEGPTEKYLSSMTYARADIDLSALIEVEEGYVVVGAVGNSMPDPNMNFTVDTVNGAPAAYWHGGDHNDLIVETVQASCENEGSITVKCNSCDYSFAQIFPRFHPYGEWNVSIEPGCATEGEEKRVCADCGAVETEIIPATGNHTWGEWEVVSPAICVDGGLDQRTCEICLNNELRFSEATGIHILTEWETYVVPDCLNPGSQKRECIYCSYYESVLIPPSNEHTWSEWSTLIAPTCITEGEEERICEICDAPESRIVNPTGEHTFGEWTVSIEPGCATEGEEARTCANCEAFETQPVPATGEHTFGEWTVAIEPGCATEGEETRSCVNCEAFETQPIPATGEHTFGEWTVSIEAGCATEGEETRTCENCEASETQSIPATGEHTYGEWVVTIEPTVLANGEQSRKCENCDATETEEIAKLEMTNPFTDVKDGQWYTEAILWCYHSGYMAGVSETEFGRRTNVTRAMFATILAKVDGGEIPEYTEEEMSFSDVSAGKWYSNAIEWASRNGYASGIGGGQFGRNNDVTRETLAQFFYTYSSLNDIDVSAEADLSGFADLERVHSWALDAVEWAVAEGLISGTTEITLAPRDSATRAEIAIIIKNYVENVKID